jgi:hypothetical protein
MTILQNIGNKWTGTLHPLKLPRMTQVQSTTSSSPPLVVLYYCNRDDLGVFTASLILIAMLSGFIFTYKLNHL